MRISPLNSITHLNLITFTVAFLGCAPETSLVSTTPDQRRPARPPIHDIGNGGAQSNAEGNSDDSIAEENPDSAVSLALYRNTPNPFNPATELSFVVPDGGGSITLTIHTVDGRRARQLVAMDLQGGEHTVIWRGRDNAGRKLPSGVYFASLRSGNETRSRKLVMVQ